MDQGTVSAVALIERYAAGLIPIYWAAATWLAAKSTSLPDK